MNKKILLSVSLIAAAAAIVVGGTIAYFTDTETSTGNTFTAGSIDLKIDSKATYNGAQRESGTWGQTGGLDIVNQKFFDFGDLKPGDYGENTISLHVYDNDAWGKFEIANLKNDDNGLTEPEKGAGDHTGNAGEGELGDALKFTVWLDQGSIPGFQNMDEDGNPIATDSKYYDAEEGDNLSTTALERPFWVGETLTSTSTWKISDVLAAAATDVIVGSTSYDYSQYSSDGHNSYGPYQGIATDGRMVGSTTYYFGIDWELPLTTGNEVQSDSLTADMIFKVVQHRNNPKQNF